MDEIAMRAGIGLVAVVLMVMCWRTERSERDVRANPKTIRPRGGEPWNR
jgi:hypothetical protein